MNHSVITSIIALFGILIGLGCAWGIYAPGRLIEWVASCWERKVVFYIAVSVRLVFGLLFLLAASETRFPFVFHFLGYLMIAAAVILTAMGRARIGRFIAWWKNLPLLLVRLWLCAGIVFGIFIVYGVIG
jgi:hypothetical protein